MVWLETPPTKLVSGIYHIKQTPYKTEMDTVNVYVVIDIVSWI